MEANRLLLGARLKERARFIDDHICVVEGPVLDVPLGVRDAYEHVDAAFVGYPQKPP